MCLFKLAVSYAFETLQVPPVNDSRFPGDWMWPSVQEIIAHITGDSGLKFT